MTPEAQRIAIAEACGWRRTMYQSPSQIPAGVPFWCKGNDFRQAEQLPDYLADLNAMHEAEKALNWSQDNDYWNMHLETVCIRNNDGNTARAKAAWRAEAFLRTLNLWDDTK